MNTVKVLTTLVKPHLGPAHLLPSVSTFKETSRGAKNKNKTVKKTSLFKQVNVIPLIHFIINIIYIYIKKKKSIQRLSVQDEASTSVIPFTTLPPTGLCLKTHQQHKQFLQSRGSKSDRVLDQQEKIDVSAMLMSTERFLHNDRGVFQQHLKTR